MDRRLEGYLAAVRGKIQGLEVIFRGKYEHVDMKIKR